MLLDEIATFLATAGYGAVGTNIFRGTRPAAPDACITVQLSPSLPNLPIQEDALGIEQPRFQVICRGIRDDFLTPYTQANSIYKSLQLIRNQTLSGVRYLKVDAAPPNEIGVDGDGRFLLSVNCEVMKIPS